MLNSFPSVFPTSAGRCPEASRLLEQRCGAASDPGFDHRLGYTERLAACLCDSRSDPLHTGEEMVRQAESWDRDRTIVAKAEYQQKGPNLRFIVTNLPIVSIDDPRRLYDDYIQRGKSEQRVDELKNGLQMDRLSCHRFMANF